MTSTATVCRARSSDGRPMAARLSPKAIVWGANKMRKERDVDLSPTASDAVKFTTCYMCACRCGIKVHLRDGQIRYIEGNRNHPVNKGALCGKGSSGDHAALFAGAAAQTAEARRRARQVGEFVEIEWDEALAIATKWLSAIRYSDPKKLAFFTGRDQSQSLTGWWAAQFGTPNFAAHGGFCSVNMAARRPLYDRRLVLGVRRTRLGPRAIFLAVRRRRGPRLQPDQGGPGQAQGARREGRLGQSDPHRLFRDRRRVGRHPPGD